VIATEKETNVKNPQRVIDKARTENRLEKKGEGTVGYYGMCNACDMDLSVPDEVPYFYREYVEYSDKSRSGATRTYCPACVETY